MIKHLLFVVLVALAFDAHAYKLIGNPPPGHTLEAGTFSPFKSAGGAVRYLEIVESSVCKPKFEQVKPSATFTIQMGGTFKRYRSPEGVSKPYPVVYLDECKVPESPEVSNPPPAETNFVGLSEVSINPTPTDPNDCTFHEWEVTKKNSDGTYILRSKRLFDAAQMINGKRTCIYKQQ